MKDCPFVISSQGNIEVNTRALLNSEEFRRQVDKACELVECGIIVIADRGERE